MIRARATSTEMLHGELRSPLPDVSSAAWMRFLDAVTAQRSSSGVGLFGLRPRRLVDLGVIERVRLVDGKAAAPRDARLVAFLADPIVQYKAFVMSVGLYDRAMRTCPLPSGMSRSGMLALHHCLGPNALDKWSQHQEPSTTALFQRANGIF